MNFQMQIHNLTEEQVEMLEHLWSLETIEDIEHFKTELPRFRRQQVDTLMELVRLQILDDMIDEDDVEIYPEAEKLIARAKRG